MKVPFLLTSILLFISISSLQAQSFFHMGINNTNPDSSAVLDIWSNDKGVLVPRMDSSAMTSIPNPENGLLVYNLTDSCFWFFKGTNWYSLCADESNSDDWMLYGNSGTNPAQNFVGSTDPADVVIRTNNTERIRIMSDGNVGVGTSNPQATLHVDRKSVV